jgi:predicted nucleic acid-binding protein
MFNLLIDTCVWLDIAKDHRQMAVLDTLETLIRDGQLHLLLPRIVVDEFLRNKNRVVEEGSRSLSSSLKRAKEAVHRLGEGRGKRVTIEHLEKIGTGTINTQLPG